MPGTPSDNVVNLMREMDDDTRICVAGVFVY